MKKTNNIILSVGIIAVLTALLLLYSGFYTAKESNNQDVRENIPENTNTVTTKSVTIIAFGDSLTAGYGLPLYESYPSQLEKVLIQTKPSVRIINAGISGETTQGNFVHRCSGGLVD